MIIDSKYISDEDMKQINKYTRKDFTRDDIYAFEVELCNNQLDIDFEKISTNCLYKLKDMVIGAVGIIVSGKDIIGKITAKIYDTYIESDCHYLLDTLDKDIPQKCLKAKAYIPRCHIQKEELESILNNSEVSIGFAVKNKTCSICGNNFDFCRHHKGQKYDNKLCYVNLDEPTDFYEWAIVPKSNNEKSKTQKTQEVFEMKTKTQLKINGEMKDVEIENGELTIIEPEKKMTGWERVNSGKRQHYIDCYNVENSIESSLEEDNALYQRANYFSNRELAENINRMQTLQRKIFRWQAENDRPVDLKTGCQHWLIVGGYGSNIEVSDFYGTNYGFLPIFSSREKAEECIEVFKDELTWLFTEFKWRMDGE